MDGRCSVSSSAFNFKNIGEEHGDCLRRNGHGMALISTWRNSIQLAGQHFQKPFRLEEQIRDENIHPADYVTSAILGSAAKAKLKVGDNEIELDRKGIKKMEKDA